MEHLRRLEAYKISIIAKVNKDSIDAGTYRFKQIRFKHGVSVAQGKWKMINSAWETNCLRGKRRAAADAKLELKRKRAETKKSKKEKEDALKEKQSNKQKTAERRRLLEIHLKKVHFYITKAKGRGKLSDLSSYLLSPFINDIEWAVELVMQRAKKRHWTCPNGEKKIDDLKEIDEEKKGQQQDEKKYELEEGTLVGERQKKKFDGGWYVGIVEIYIEERGWYKVVYDDGDWHELHFEEIRNI